MNWKISFQGDAFGGVDKQTDKIEYMEQSFHKQSGTVDTSSDGSIYSAIGSFVCDYGHGFTQAGITRINDSIRTFVWAILGAQAGTRTSIIGKGKAFDTQKQFLANVETAIKSAVDIPASKERYQDVLGNARSKVDFVVGFDNTMMPSDMDLYIGTINGYNNLLIDASESDTTLVLGRNDELNDTPPLPAEVIDDDIVNRGPAAPLLVDSGVQDVPAGSGVQGDQSARWNLAVDSGEPPPCRMMKTNCFLFSVVVQLFLL
jgi:hypothetical protein